jgi:surfactin synthase thioesterase subunit/acyl carrier protein
VPLDKETRILQTGAPVFDATTFEMWGSLLNGGQLVLVAKKVILDALQLKQTIIKQRINTLWLSALLFNQLLQVDIELFAPLYYLLVGGDILSPGHINRARKCFPGLKIINGYGPTENTTFSTTYLIEREFEQNIPIGKPIANSTVYIVDKNQCLLPIGVVGELYVGGDGVSRGYMNNPELTCNKFRPLMPQITQMTQMKNKSGALRANLTNDQCPMTNDYFYRTGDLARWITDGNIEFLGRRDSQVKIRGHRIEMGEIENRLLKHRNISHAVVVLGGDKEQPFLCAYFVANQETPVAELRNYLKEVLPDYMVPTCLIQLEKLPYTTTNKIDRKALPDPRTIGMGMKKHQSPANEDEAAILQIWSEVLAIAPGKISTGDDFFDLGGNSINILKIQAMLRKYFEYDISMNLLFLHPTIKELAAGIKCYSSAEEKKLDCVIKLNKSGSKKNIFIFHPLHGMTYPYKELAKLLEDRFSVYGIQAKGLTVDGPLPGNLEEMLNDYLKEIRQVQAKGPYIFSGYCVGNFLAYEAARVMEDQGEQVETLILLDIGTIVPEKYGLIFKLKRYLEGFFFLHHITRKKEIPQNIGEASEEQKRLIARIKENIANIFRGYFYKRVIESPLIHIRAQENLSLYLFQKNWLKLSRGKVKLLKCTGHHHNIFVHPHVDNLAEIINTNI